ncbi:MAG: beta family protein [Mycolicibacterium sp.]|nr:beta family protein [Mycolicibacterium sp.]
MPVLFTKAGERDALKAIDDASKASFTPLLVVHPIAWNFERDQWEKTIDAHLAKLPAELVKSWGKRDAFIDVRHVDGEEMADGRHPIEWVVAQARSEGLTLVPVVTPSNSAEYVSGVRRLLSGPTNEVCLRLDAGEWPVPPQDTAIDDFIRSIGTTKANVHLVLDLRDNTEASARFALMTALRSLATPRSWKTLTVTATAMPQVTPSGRGIHEVLRADWSNYRNLIDNSQYGSRKPTFGDYGIAHPDPLADIDPRMLQISAKLKYTCEDKWLLARGGLYKANGGRSGGSDEIRPVARQLVARREFTATHCGGDRWISSAAGAGAAGNPRTWVKIATWHHLQRVVGQIAQS